MRTLLLAFGLFFVIALPAFADKGFSTDFESDSVALPFPKGLQMDFDRLSVCGAMINGDLEVGLVGPSGCSIDAPGTPIPIMFRTFSREDVREFVGLAITTMNNQSYNPLGRTNASGAFETALQDVIAAAFKREALDWTDASCAGGEPAPGTCGTGDPIQCCQMDPGNGSGSGSGSSGGASGGFEPQVASGAVGGDPRNNNGGLAGGDGLPGGSSGGASGGGSGEQYVNRAFELISVKSDDQYSFFIVDTEDKGRATPDNIFGFCTPDSSESAFVGANVTIGALESAGCPPNHSFTPYGEFMGDLSMAGLAVAAPFWANPAWITPIIPVIPYVVVGGAVVVGGYFLYEWWTSESPRALINMVTVSCQNLCVVADAARAVAIEVFVDTIIRLTREISEEVRKQFEEAIERYGDLKGEACCATLCTVLRLLINGPTGCGAFGCFRECYMMCSGSANGWTVMSNLNCQCSSPGWAAGAVCGAFY